MTFHRFFVSPELLAHDSIPIKGELAHQLSRVLRLKPGDLIELLNNTGQACRVELTQVASDQCMAIKQSCYYPNTEPTTRLVLYQGLAKGRKVEWVLQKATELGASELVPMITSRSMVTDPRQIGRSKLERWQRIIQEAAEQSGRAFLPELRPALTFEQAIGEAQPGDCVLIGALSSEAVPIRQALEASQTPPAIVRLYVGPEGGFEDQEVAQARACGVLPVSLGPRILRTETAGLAMLAVVAYALGEMEQVRADA